MLDPVRILQLSDTHFLDDPRLADSAEGVTPEGGFAYDTSEAFDAIFDHIADRQSSNGMQADLVVVTGDVADHGLPEQYRHAANQFSRFDMPVNICPGNHDQDAALSAGIGRLGVSTSRVVEAGAWCFLFVDSNAGVMVEDETGRCVDVEDTAVRLHRNGSLGQREAAWIRDMCALTLAEHVFVWVHHPPDAPIPMVGDVAYAAEWEDLLTDLPIIRGFGAGHTHVPDTYTNAGRPVFVAPSLKHNFDLEAATWLPPGYRTFEFAADGTISSELHLVDDERWPRRRLGRALQALFAGELTHEQLEEIATRRQQSTG